MLLALVFHGLSLLFILLTNFCFNVYHLTINPTFATLSLVLLPEYIHWIIAPSLYPVMLNPPNQVYTNVKRLTSVFSSPFISYAILYFLSSGFVIIIIVDLKPFIHLLLHLRHNYLLSTLPYLFKWIETSSYIVHIWPWIVFFSNFCWLKVLLARISWRRHIFRPWLITAMPSGHAHRLNELLNHRLHFSPCFTARVIYLILENEFYVFTV